MCWPGTCRAPHELSCLTMNEKWQVPGSFLCVHSTWFALSHLVCEQDSATNEIHWPLELVNGTNLSMMGKKKVLLTYYNCSSCFIEKLAVVESISLRIILACLRLVSFFDQVYYCLVFLRKKYSIFLLGWLTCQNPHHRPLFTILSIPKLHSILKLQDAWEKSHFIITRLFKAFSWLINTLRINFCNGRDASILISL